LEGFLLRVIVAILSAPVTNNTKLKSVLTLAERRRKPRGEFTGEDRKTEGHENGLRFVG